MSLINSDNTFEEENLKDIMAKGVEKYIEKHND